MTPVRPDGALTQTAEEFAAGMIRRALDSAVRPDLQNIADESGLTVREVEAVRDRILSGKRGTQTLGRPRAATPPLQSGATAVPPAGPAGHDEQLVADALRHRDPRVRRLAKKCVDVRQRYGSLRVELREAIELSARSSAEAEQRRRRIAKLEAELAELRGKKPAKSAVLPCPVDGCGRSFTKQGWLNQHMRGAHGADA